MVHIQDYINRATADIKQKMTSKNLQPICYCNEKDKNILYQILEENGVKIIQEEYNANTYKDFTLLHPAGIPLPPTDIDKDNKSFMRALAPQNDVYGLLNCSYVSDPIAQGIIKYLQYCYDRLGNNDFLSNKRVVIALPEGRTRDTLLSFFVKNNCYTRVIPTHMEDISMFSNNCDILIMDSNIFKIQEQKISDRPVLGPFISIDISGDIIHPSALFFLTCEDIFELEQLELFNNIVSLSYIKQYTEA